MKAFLLSFYRRLLQNSLLHYSYFNCTGGAQLKQEKKLSLACSEAKKFKQFQYSPK